jgi:hypothetical protein
METESGAGMGEGWGMFFLSNISVYHFFELEFSLPTSILTYPGNYGPRSGDIFVMGITLLVLKFERFPYTHHTSLLRTFYVLIHSKIERGGRTTCQGEV